MFGISTHPDDKINDILFKTHTWVVLNELKQKFLRYSSQIFTIQASGPHAGQHLRKAYIVNISVE